MEYRWNWKYFVICKKILIYVRWKKNKQMPLVPRLLQIFRLPLFFFTFDFQKVSKKLLKHIKTSWKSIWKQTLANVVCVLKLKDDVMLLFSLLGIELIWQVNKSFIFHLCLITLEDNAAHLFLSLIKSNHSYFIYISYLLNDVTKIFSLDKK